MARFNPMEGLARGLILAYRYTLSPLVGPACRHLPSCSDYALQAIERHGLRRGSGLALARLTRCHPWGSHGFDPVPDRLGGGFLHAWRRGRRGPEKSPRHASSPSPLAGERKKTCP